MAEGSGTRSSLLWEVKRILLEMDELPQVLIMENVPQVVKQSGFEDWIAFLNTLGYKNEWRILNAADYGIPQKRKRCFMVSWLGNYDYSFPAPVPLKHQVIDYLDKEVEDKYYISEDVVKRYPNAFNHVERESRAIRAGGRRSYDKHSWDIAFEPYC